MENSQFNQVVALLFLGAIDNRIGLIHFNIFEGSSKTMKVLMLGLKKKLKKDKAAIVLDNLPIHKSH